MTKPQTTKDEAPLTANSRGRLLLGKTIPRYKKLMEEFAKWVANAKN